MSKGNLPSNLLNIHEYPFEDEDIVLDFHAFKKCKFKNCKLIFHGHGPVKLESCMFDSCSWEFAGPAANTLNFMTALYHNKLGAEKIIEQTINNIINGTY